MNREYIQNQLKRTNRNILLASLFSLVPSIYLFHLIEFEALSEFLDAPSAEDIMLILILEFGNVLLLIIGVLLLILSFVLLLKSIIRMANIENHPLYRIISFNGQFNLMSQEINHEVSDHVRYKNANIIITDNWFIQEMIFNTNILSLNDVIRLDRSDVSYQQSMYMPGVLINDTEVGKSFGLVIKSKNPYLPVLKISIFHEKDLILGSTENSAEEQRKINNVIYIQNLILAKKNNFLEEFLEE